MMTTGKHALLTLIVAFITSTAAYSGECSGPPRRGYLVFEDKKVDFPRGDFFQEGVFNLDILRIPVESVPDYRKMILCVKDSTVQLGKFQTTFVNGETIVSGSGLTLDPDECTDVIDVDRDKQKLIKLKAITPNGAPRRGRLLIYVWDEKNNPNDDDLRCRP